MTEILAIWFLIGFLIAGPIAYLNLLARRDHFQDPRLGPSHPPGPLDPWPTRSPDHEAP
jgi:hypothetical protein